MAATLARIVGGQSLLQHRPHDHQEYDEGEERQHHHLGEAHDVVLGEGEQRGDERGRLGRNFRRGTIGKAQVNDFDLVAAIAIEADGRAHERRDPVEFFLRARLIGHLAARIADIDAVDEHGDGHALDAPALLHLGARGAGNLVIDDFLVLVALVAGRATLSAIGAGQFIADAHPAFGIRGCLRLCAGLCRAHHAAFRIEGLGPALDAVHVHFGRDLDARPAIADDTRDDILDLRLHAPLEGRLLLFRHRLRAGLILRPVGQKPPALVHDGNA
jgi:hypothetical protein